MLHRFHFADCSFRPFDLENFRWNFGSQDVIRKSLEDHKFAFDATFLLFSMQMLVIRCKKSMMSRSFQCTCLIISFDVHMIFGSMCSPVVFFPRCSARFSSHLHPLDDCTNFSLSCMGQSSWLDGACIHLTIAPTSAWTMDRQICTKMMSARSSPDGWMEFAVI